MFNFSNVNISVVDSKDRWHTHISIHRQLYIHLYMYIYKRQSLRKSRTSKRRRGRIRARVYLRSKAVTDSPVLTGKFHFLSTNGRLKGTNIGFGYYLFDLRPISYTFSIYLRVTNCTCKIDSALQSDIHIYLCAVNFFFFYREICCV